jgi:FkbM family methyltransferase
MPESRDEKELQNGLTELFHEIPSRDNFIRPVEGRFALYGAGGLGNLGYQLLKSVGLKPDCILDMNSSISSLHDVPVVHPESVSAADRESMSVLVCVVNSPFSPIRDYLHGLGYCKVQHFYNAAEAYTGGTLISNGWMYDSPTATDREKIPAIFHRLADRDSRCAYLQMLYWRLRREERLFFDYRPNPGTKWYPPDVIPPPTEPQVILDGGTHDGTILQKHIDYAGSFLSKIFAFEPDPDNTALLEDYVSKLPDLLKSKITLDRRALGDGTANLKFAAHRDLASFVTEEGDMEVGQTTIDALNIEKLSLVKLHIEGSEYPAICGAIDTFTRCRPILALTTYHTPDGLWKIQEYLMDRLEGYDFFIRLHAYCGIGCITYAVPSERRADLKHSK